MRGFFYIKYTYFLPCSELGSSPAGYSTSAVSGLVLYDCFLFPWHILFDRVFTDAFILRRYSAALSSSSGAARAECCRCTSVLAAAYLGHSDLGWLFVKLWSAVA